MKRCKRQLSICIVLAMLISLLAYSSAVSAQAPLVFEDFEGESNKLGADCVNETFEGHNAGKISKTSGSIDFEDTNSGGVKLSFDAYMHGETGKNVNTTVIATAADGTEYNTLQLFQHRVRYVTGDQANIYAKDNGWHHIEQVFNLNDGTVNTSVYDMEGNFLAEGTEAIGVKSVTKISFKSISSNMDFYVDNINIETCEVETVQGVLAEEDFEGAESIFESNCVNETFEGKKAGRVAKGKTSVDFADVTSGYVKLSLDVYLKGASGSNVNTIFVVNPASSFGGSDCNILQVFQHRVRYATGEQANIHAKDNGWHHIEQILNLGDGTVKTLVYTMDGKKQAEGNEYVGCNSIGGMTFNNQSSNHDFYMDNFKVETYDPTQEPGEPDIPDTPVVPAGPYLEENFEGEKNAFSSNCTNQTFEGVDGKVGVIVYNPAGSGQYTSSVEFTDITEGGARIVYDLYLVGGQSHYIKGFPASGKEYPLLQVDGLGIGLTNGGASFFSATTKGWVRVEQLMKTDTGEIRTNIYSMDGELLGSASNTVAYNSIGSMTFCNWSAGSKMNLYIDNLLVESYNPPPEISYESFVMKSYAGNVLSGTRDLTPGIGTIAINFGTKMKADTLSGIVLKKDGGEEINMTGKLDGMVYTLTLLQGLEPQSKYKLVVPATVASIADVTLGSKFTYEFTTGAGETSAVVTDVTKSGISISKLSQIAKGDKLSLSVSYGNISAKELPITLVVAYYNGKTIAGFDVQKVMVPAGFGTMKQEITVPSLENVDQVKIVTLNGLYSMLAYHLPIIIK